ALSFRGVEHCPLRTVPRSSRNLLFRPRPAQTRLLDGGDSQRRRNRLQKSNPNRHDHSNTLMKIHENQAKAILKKYGVAVPRGEMVDNREQAEAVAKSLFDQGAGGVVVKAQIHAGGRGKGGGVKIAKSVAEAGELASKMLGMTLVTHQ